MRIGVLKEIKDQEYRVGMVPAMVQELVHQGHEILIEQDAGLGSGFLNEEYQAAGGRLASSSDIFSSCDLIVKVKEPQPAECKQLREGQTLFTYLHLAADPEQARLLIESKCIAIAYETVTDDIGGLPLLAPMSEIAGRISVQAGAHYLEKTQGGRGVLLGGVSGVSPAKVLVIGGGVVGTQALRVALGMGARVIVLDKSIKRLRDLDMAFSGKLLTSYPTTELLQEHLPNTDLVIGAVLVPGNSAPKILSRSLMQLMRPHTVVVDVAIDQGGCFETSRSTTHTHPTYVEEGVTHYCVANIPACVPRTASIALGNATLPHVMAIANKGCKEACESDKHLMNGVNIFRGLVVHAGVASALNETYTPLPLVLKQVV